MAKILKGADVVSALGEKMSLEIESLKKRGITPTLATLRVGERADDISYEKSIIKRCESVGVAVKSIALPDDVTQEELLICIDGFNNDKKVHGVLMFRPLPKHICEDTVRNALCPEKDIDGITDTSLASVFTGSDKGFAPCTARACIEILDFYGIDCTGKKAVVIGRSLVVGKPVAIMLMGKNATVTVCHTRTVNIPAIARQADILIVAAGRAESITKEFMSSGQTIIDVGINWNEQKGKLVGDVLFNDAEPIVEAVTPVPGGVGTVTTSVLVSNVVKAASE
ncbi:MAG: bifunctional 5,10-methylene-tetrahydrofolate dehydrogenase/5,10-methylene-tetrahydrofolate cyclohydrolase [Oscillospiraceae bacterium]|nr:bifunctional 5,10-methylene-tetrahydrofolate dehydrogenase/5,10-methylene-tetrahydrofolate cyclohydrolase [Oscillospiraceae bacterium]MCL2279113.1 bifunctional 5,10-methylene-tetrahydrofolate dehydrogenase/5,10-methylene-tetrahydrofolate cyclohydrolase [Oscillospiraceae bacterium]